MSSVPLTSDSSRPGATAGRSERISYRKLLVAFLVAAVVAAAGSAVLFLIGSAAGLITPDVILPTGAPMTVFEPIFSSVVGTVGATTALAIIARFTRRPIRIFRIVAAIVLVLSFTMPLGIAGAPLSYLAVVELMHVWVAGVAVTVLPALARES